jgi:hypothetical protein
MIGPRRQLAGVAQRPASSGVVSADAAQDARRRSASLDAEAGSAGVDGDREARFGDEGEDLVGEVEVDDNLVAEMLDAGAVVAHLVAPHRVANSSLRAPSIERSRRRDAARTFGPIAGIGGGARFRYGRCRSFTAV